MNVKDKRTYNDYVITAKLIIMWWQSNILWYDNCQTYDNNMISAKLIIIMW